jgi:hypothetical protein
VALLISNPIFLLKPNFRSIVIWKRLISAQNTIFHNVFNHILEASHICTKHDFSQWFQPHLNFSLQLFPSIVASLEGESMFIIFWLLRGLFHATSFLCHLQILDHELAKFR